MARTVDSFFTTTWMCYDEGMGYIEGCCLDSGYASAEFQGSINPNVVTVLELDTYPVDIRCTLADGSHGRYRHAVRVPLTFHTMRFTITLELDLLVSNFNAGGYNLLLGTDVLHRLGGVHDHRSNPSTFKVTHPDTGKIDALEPDDTKYERKVTWVYKTDQYSYLKYLVNCSAFGQSGYTVLPKVAVDDVGSSNELFYYLMRIWREDTIYNMNIRPSCEHLIEVMAKVERRNFAIRALEMEPEPVGITAGDIHDEIDIVHDSQPYEEEPCSDEGSGESEEDDDEDEYSSDEDMDGCPDPMDDNEVSGSGYEHDETEEYEMACHDDEDDGFNDDGDYW